MPFHRKAQYLYEGIGYVGIYSQFCMFLRGYRQTSSKPLYIFEYR